METSQIHQTKYDQRTKPAAIAPTHGDRDEDVANETNRADRAMVYLRIKGGSTTLSVTG
jgi:hypothetical protein